MELYKTIKEETQRLNFSWFLQTEDNESRAKKADELKNMPSLTHETLRFGVFNPLKIARRILKSFSVRDLEERIYKGDFSQAHVEAIKNVVSEECTYIAHRFLDSIGYNENYTRALLLAYPDTILNAMTQVVKFLYYKAITYEEKRIQQIMEKPEEQLSLDEIEVKIKKIVNTNNQLA